MNPGNWIALLGVLSTIVVGLLAIFVPVMLGVLSRKNATIEQLREANLNYRFALLQLGGTAETVTRTLSALPIPPNDGSSG